MSDESKDLMFYDIPIDNMTNKYGMVQAVKQCGCGRLLWWTHRPGNPKEFEPENFKCHKCSASG